MHNSLVRLKEYPSASAYTFGIIMQGGVCCQCRCMCICVCACACAPVHISTCKHAQKSRRLTETQRKSFYPPACAVALRSHNAAFSV